MMIRTYTVTPDLWLPFATAVVLAGLGLYSWRRGGVPGARVFAVVCLFSLFWLFGIAGEAGATDFSAKVAWHKFQSLWYVPTATALACFALAYARPGYWLTPRVLGGLTVVALAFMALMLTNEWHHLVWHPLVGDNAIRPDYAVGGWIMAAYALLLALVQIVAFGWLFAHSPEHRRPILLMVLAVVVTRVTLLFEFFQPNATATPGLGALVFLQAAVIYGVALFGFRIFEPVPAAFRTVVAQMQTGIVVFDRQARIVNMNPAAEQILQVRSNVARGKTWQEVTPSAAQVLTCVHGGADAVTLECAGAEFELGDGPDARRYVPAVSPLYDARGLDVGQLLTLSDVTEQRRAQAQIVAQQRTLAALHERELLARELHDTIGQVLGYAGLQVSAAGQLIVADQAPAAAAQLNRLEHVLQDAHADLRAQILNLRTTPLLDDAFFAGIRHYVDGFRDNYGINVTLEVAKTVDGQRISPEARLQLFRIMQEALTNARKHSRARHVDVQFTADDQGLGMQVEDDGCGFFVDAGPLDGGHFGLQFMRERVHEVGGSLRIESAPGAGTRIVATIPRKET